MPKKTIRRGLCCTILFVLVILAGARDLRSENVFLKDGRIMSGVIVNDAARSITLKDAKGRLDTIPRDDILRILYTKLSMGKIHVQMRDGRSFEAFIVDEDQNSYTLRKELLRPDEMKVERTEVLFISERNPSGLKAVPDTTEIELSWYPPYNTVAHYLVYLKTQGEGEFRQAAKSRRASHTLEDLKSNTAYTMKVTAVDDAGEESLPSNVITVTTKNILPERPRVLSLTKAPSAGGAAFRARWEPSRDPDGTVEKYRIYALKGGERKLLGETREETYTVNAGTEQGGIFLCAVDDRGDESGQVRLFGRAMHIALSPGVLYPLGSFGAIVGPGFGATASFSLHNYFLDNLVLGAEAGFYYFPSRESNVEDPDNGTAGREYKKTQTTYMIPMIVTGGYRFELNYRFSVIPYAGVGVAYFHSDFMRRDRVTYIERSGRVSEWGPAISAGAAGSCRINEHFSAVLRLYIGYLAGADSGVYLGCDIGCLYRL